jgi:hypothetical protein
VVRAKNARGKLPGIIGTLDKGIGVLLGALEALKEEFPEGLWSNEGELVLV